ncbi:PA14 domain-containing protein [Nibrella saemangeumensis]|uniref:PA14 domain-containing protein n=2 Tax=Nibrella saemangeumensis TaxID=1084526 RepID=A0ABP8N8N1_9BACT
MAGSLALAQTGNGLKGEYFNGPNFEQKAYTRTDPQVSFDWNWRYPAPGVQREYFSVRWTGKLYAPTTGKYRFSATVDDGVRVWVGGKRVIDEWRKQDDTQFVGEITLQAKHYYDLKVEYYNDWKGSIIFVYWETPQDRKENLFGYTSKPYKTIPTQYLFSKPVAAGPVTAQPQATITSAKSSARAATLVPTVVTAKPAANPKAFPPAKKPNVTTLKSTGRVAVATPVVKAPAVFTNLVKGEAVILKNVFFEQSKYVLLPESSTELNKLVQTLKDQPSLRIDIVGHTDNIGDPRLNQALSENRAKVVATYLIRNGITSDRLETKGYGGTRPIADNTVESERARNRRVEFVVR